MQKKKKRCASKGLGETSSLDISASSQSYSKHPVIHAVVHLPKRICTSVSCLNAKHINLLSTNILMAIIHAYPMAGPGEKR